MMEFDVSVCIIKFDGSTCRVYHFFSSNLSSQETMKSTHEDD